MRRWRCTGGAGVIPGYAIVGGYPRAFRYSGAGPMQDLGFPAGDVGSKGFAINNAGIIVGLVETNRHDHAALWRTDNSVVDLDAWLDTVNPIEGAKWELQEATAINNTGLIVGNGAYNDGPGGLEDGPRAFVLDINSLVPEPGNVAVLWTCAFLFVPLSRRRRSPIASAP